MLCTMFNAKNDVNAPTSPWTAWCNSLLTTQYSGLAQPIVPRQVAAGHHALTGERRAAVHDAPVVDEEHAAGPQLEPELVLRRLHVLAQQTQRFVVVAHPVLLDRRDRRPESVVTAHALQLCRQVRIVWLLAVLFEFSTPQWFIISTYVAF